MSRIVLEKSAQRRFLDDVCGRIGIKRASIICKVCERTLRDWRRAKFNMRYEAACNLAKESGSILPSRLKVEPEYWYVNKAARMGGKATYEKYGCLGTLESRRKGGFATQKRARQDPAYAKRVGINIRTEITYPPESKQLAEFIGIMLGDGGIASYQIRITYDRLLDRKYSKYIQKIVHELFGVSSVIVKRRSCRANDIVVSSRNVVEFLTRKGLKVGSKIRNKVDVPGWVIENINYGKACLRGLIDTDGSFYGYKHRVGGKEYSSFAMCFTSHSELLLDSVYRMLLSLGFSPVKSGKHVYLNKKMDIGRYFDIIGSSNPKHLKKYENMRRGTEAVITGRSRKPLSM